MIKVSFKKRGGSLNIIIMWGGGGEINFCLMRRGEGV